MVSENVSVKKGEWMPPAILAKARALYVVKGLQPKEIAERLGVKPQKLYSLVHSKGWVAEREKKSLELSKRLDAGAHDENAAFLESMASQSEELAEDCMDISRQAVTQGLGATRELQQASQSLKNFVDVYRSSRGLDNKGSGTQVNIGSLYCSLSSQATPPPEKNVTPEPAALGPPKS